MSPHTQYAHRFLGEHVVDHAALNVDAEEVSACQITQQLFERRWILKCASGKNCQQLLHFYYEEINGVVGLKVSASVCPQRSIRPLLSVSELGVPASSRSFNARNTTSRRQKSSGVSAEGCVVKARVSKNS